MRQHRVGLKEVVERGRDGETEANLETEALRRKGSFVERGRQDDLLGGWQAGAELGA